MVEYISHIVISKEVLGLKPRAVIDLIKSGAWGRAFRPSYKLWMVRVDEFNKWVEKHQVKKAA